jgi:hypothetical protein
MKLRNYRLVIFICSCLTLSTFTIAVNNITYFHCECWTANINNPLTGTW